MGYEYTPPFVGAVFVKPESEIQKDMRSLEPLLDQQTILGTHAPAYGTLDRSYLDQHVAAILWLLCLIAHACLHTSMGTSVATSGETAITSLCWASVVEA